MALVSLQQVSMSFGDDPLLDGVDLQVEPRERICLLGRNGAGKSTLLRLLQGSLEPEAGRVDRAPGVRVSTLPQELPASLPGTISEILLRFLEEAVEGAGIADWDLPVRVDKILTRLGLEGDQPYDPLSVGRKRRVLLGRALLLEPDLLLLDEPTNHLDLEAVRWIEDFLPGFGGATLFVSHDREFIRGLSTRILELDRGQLHSWRCDYPTYLKRSREQREAEEARAAELDKKLAREEQWIRRGIKARRVRDQGRVRALEKLREEVAARRKKSGTARMTATTGARGGQLVLRAENVSFGFGEETLIRDFSVEVTRGEKIALIGPNGVGKTTLLRVLLGELSPRSGTVKTGVGLEISYLDQLHEDLDPEKTVLETVAAGNDTLEIGGRPRHALAYLGDFQFTPEQARGKIGHLSGGERNRVSLARLFTLPSNVLVLDEPTNDLDIETLEQLEELVVNYPGTVLLVSHDRAFIDNVATSTWSFAGDGEVREYFGGYTDLLAQLRLQEEDRAAKGAPSPSRGERKPGKVDAPSPPRRRERKLGYREVQELEALPARIESLETELADVQKALSEPDFYQRPPAEISEMTRRLESLGQEIEQAYERWTDLEERSGA